MSTPPLPPSSGGLPPAGWYLDPTTPDQQRYWDGTAWSDHVAPQYRYGPPPAQAAVVVPNYPPPGLVASPVLLGPGAVPYASFWRRLFGLVIDGLIFTPLVLVVGLLFAGPFFAKISQCLELTSQSEMNACINSVGDQLAADATWVSLVSILIGVLQVGYFTVCLKVWGRTIGGLAMGIRCVTASSANPSWSKAFVRSLIPFGFSLLGLVPILGLFALIVQLIAYLAMLWSPTRQTWMDRAAGTFVIKPVK